MARGRNGSSPGPAAAPAREDQAGDLEPVLDDQAGTGERYAYLLTSYRKGTPCHVSVPRACPNCGAYVYRRDIRTHHRMHVEARELAETVADLVDVAHAQAEEIDRLKRWVQMPEDDGP